MSTLAIGKSYAVLGAVQGFHGAKETWKGVREKTRSAVGREKVWDLQTHKDKGGGEGRDDVGGLEKGAEGMKVGDGEREEKGKR